MIITSFDWVKYLFFGLTTIVGIIWVRNGILYLQGKKVYQIRLTNDVETYRLYLPTTHPLQQKFAFCFIAGGIGWLLTSVIVPFYDTPLALGSIWISR